MKRCALVRVYMRIDASAHRPLDTIWRFDSGMTNVIRDRVESQIADLLERVWGKEKGAV